MKTGTTGQASVHVAVAPSELYDMVSDVTRMGEWSPETVRCEWLDGATRAESGARFKGSNKRGLIRWSTTPEVVIAEPGREFAFVTKPSGSTKWTYRFEASPGGGTDLTESFELMTDTPGFVDFIERYVMRIKDRKADLERGMQETLGRIKSVAEARG